MAGKTEYKNKYAAEKYDRIGLMFKKGTKDVIQQAATAKGDSLNGYIKKAIETQYSADTGENIEL